MTQPTNLYEHDIEGLGRLVEELGEPEYRARQIWNWLYRNPVSSLDEMTSLSKKMRRALADSATLYPFQSVTSLVSSDGNSEKVLFGLADGKLIETVLMQYDKRRTVCVSTQAGCAMGCVFCATGQMGFQRNLTVGEIVAQVLFFARQLSEVGERVTNLVFMGMGEPLHNYEQTLAAVDRLSHPLGLGLGARRMTISTVGLVPAMKRYADEKRQTPLAVSLHAATDEERDRLIPVNRRWPLAELIDACHYVVAQTGRRLTFEWALIADENDSVEQAQRLGALLKGMLCHVNLIPLNPTKGYAGRPSSPQRVAAFQETLARYGLSSTVRVRRGIDIQAGCGQLRDRELSGRALD